MSHDGEVYDLGSVHLDGSHASATAVPQAPRRSRQHSSPPVTEVRSSGPALAGSLSVLVPGVGQLARGKAALGLFFLSFMGLLGTLTWAVLETFERLTGTLAVLGYPPAAAVWTLLAFYGAAALLHLGSISTSGSTAGGSAHPAVSGFASLLVPGWGQVLNGNPGRAVLFLGMLWAVGAAWLVVSPPVESLLASQNLYLPRPAELLCSSAVRWTVPAVVWSLAVYDATVSADRR